MIRRAAVVLALATLLLALAVHAGAATPEGPRLAISVATDGPGAEDEAWEVITTGPSGEDPQRLVGDLGVLIGDGLSWSADGNRLAFPVHGVESTAEEPFGTGWSVVAVAEADGSSPRAFPRAFLNAGTPVMAPDGATVAFQRIKLVKVLPGRENYLFGSSIWLLDVEGGSVKRLTRWRLAAFIDPISFSPDGLSIIATLLDRRGQRIVTVDLGSRRIRRLALLADDVREPTYSPDGTELAYIREKDANAGKLPEKPISELIVARADGSGARRVLRRKGYISFPSWDPSGSRLAFTRDPPAEATGGLEPESGNKVMAINADGTCMTRVFTGPEVTVGGSAWQPGAGREAGPISC